MKSYAIAVTVLLIAAASNHSFPKATNSVFIKGIVRDSTDTAAIDSAHVYGEHSTIDCVGFSTYTDWNGYYCMTDTTSYPPGYWWVTAEHEGYYPQTKYVWSPTQNYVNFYLIPAMTEALAIRVGQSAMRGQFLHQIGDGR